MNKTTKLRLTPPPPTHAQHISFTGSVSTGKHIAAAAALDLKRVTLELGGNDAAIVMPDADIPATASKIFKAAMANTGQVGASNVRGGECSSVRRAVKKRPPPMDFSCASNARTLLRCV